MWWKELVFLKFFEKIEKILKILLLFENLCEYLKILEKQKFNFFSDIEARSWWGVGCSCALQIFWVFWEWGRLPNPGDATAVEPLPSHLCHITQRHRKAARCRWLRVPTGPRSRGGRECRAAVSRKARERLAQCERSPRVLAAQREHLRVQHERRERQPGVLLTPRARAHWIHVLERWLLAHSSYEHSTPLILRVTYEWLLVLACARAYSSWWPSTVRCRASAPTGCACLSSTTRTLWWTRRATRSPRR